MTRFMRTRAWRDMLAIGGFVAVIWLGYEVGKGDEAMVALPDIIAPETLAEQMGWSLRRLKALARSIGACRIMGNRMALTQQDVDAIMEASRPCPSSSKSAGRSGTTPVQSGSGDYAALQRLRRSQKPSASPTRSKASNSKVIAIRAQH